MSVSLVSVSVYLCERYKMVTIVHGHREEDDGRGELTIGQYISDEAGKEYKLSGDIEERRVNTF